MRTFVRRMTYFVLIALVFELINPSFVAASYTKEPAQDKMVFEIKPKSGPYVKYPAAPKPPKVEVVVAVKAAPTAKPAVKKVAKVAKVQPQAATVAVTGRTMNVIMTAYSSTPDQTDGNPFVTASGSTVHFGTVAANFLPFGTKIRIPDYFGKQIFTVEDRTAKRFSNRVDVWFPTRGAAIQFGKRTLRIEIL